MSKNLIEFYKVTLGPEMANLIEGAMDKERNRIIEVIKKMETKDCCWQYHSGHLAKSDIIAQIKDAS